MSSREDVMEKILNWFKANPTISFEFIRMYLGIILILKGLFFLGDINMLSELIGLKKSTYGTLALAHYIVFAHMIGGAFLVMGLLTRIVVLFQIPVLAGAVFLVHFQEGLFGGHASLEFALIVLLLLIAYAVYGSGRLSVDFYLGRRQAT